MKIRPVFPLTCAIAALFANPLATAATLYWDANAGTALQTDGAGAWLTANQWWNGTTNVTWTSGDDAVFGNGGAGGAVTLASPTTVNSLTFNSFTGTYTVGTAGQTITLNNGITVNGTAGVVNISSPITLGAAQSWVNHSANLLTVGTGAVNNGGFLLTIGGGSNTTISSVISGAGGLTKTGVGVLSLSSAASNYTGATTISGGILDVSTFAAAGSNSSIGTGSGSAADLVLNGGTLRKSSNNVSTTNRLFSVGTDGGTIESSHATVTNTLSFTGTGAMGFNSQLGSRNLTLTGTNTGNNTIALAIGNDGSNNATSLTKTGSGTWVMSGTNTYTGNTLVRGGMLQFTNQVSLYNNGAAAIWSNTNINVESGATLAFNVGGAGQFTKADINTILGLSNAADNGFNSGSILGLDTTGGSLLFDSIIANTNGGTNVLGLTKLGTNTLTLDQDNTYTGATFISAGTLQLGNGSTTGKLSTSSSILNNGTFTINRSDAVVQGTDFSAAPIVGTGAFIQAGTGTTTLNAANTFSGTTTVSAGTLTLTNALALQNSALVTTTGTTTLSGITGALTIGGLSGSRDLGSANVLSGYTGNISALTLNPQTGVSVTYSGIISDATVGMSLTKTGAGTQILSGANTYTGATIVNAGVLTLGSGANGSLSSLSALQVGSGGTFNYARTGSGQTLAGLTVNTGVSTINNTSGQTLTLGAITRAAGNGTINFGTTTLGSISTTVGNVNGMIGAWATTGTTTTLRYAVGSADGTTPTNIAALTGTAATAGTLANVTDATGNFEYSAAVTTTSNLTANTLRYSGAATATAIGATNTLTLNGLMNAGTGLLTISGGPSTGGIIIGSTNELVIAANAQATTISAVIADGGSAGRLVYSGGATLTLSGNNTFSGGLTINAGTVLLNTPVSNSFDGNAGAGAITVNSGGTLQISSSNITTLSRNMTLNGGTFQFSGSGTALSYTGNLTLGANSTIAVGANNAEVDTISGPISGAGGFTKTGGGGLRLNGTNTYAGPTVVSAGGLTVKSSLYGNDTTKWTAANITVARGATLMLNVQGTGEFTIAQAATMFSQLSTNINNNGLLAGSFIGVDTRNASAGTYVYSGIITDSTGNGGGSVGFKHTGSANTILELTGANSYSGPTIVDGPSTLRVSSFNSVFTNATLGTVHSTTSSLGAPTTVANGTIYLGSGGSPSSIGNNFLGGSLTYTGTGETTDRVISLGGGGNDSYTFDQSGTGHLKFLSSFVLGDGRGVKTFNLQGSTAGTAELAGTIPNGSNGNSNRVTKSGTGTWILSGTNVYAGITTISAGTLEATNLANGGVASAIGQSTNAAANLVFGAPTATLRYTGASDVTTDRSFTMSSGAGGGATIESSGAGTLSFNNTVALNYGTNNQTRTLTLGGTNTGNNTFGKVIANNGSGAASLVKAGTGMWALTQVNTYSGTTSINQGILAVNGTGSINNSAVTINGGNFRYNSSVNYTGTFTHTAGTISGTNWNGSLDNQTIATGEFISPGNSPGTASTGGQTWAAGGTYVWEINNVTGTAGADPGWDLINGTGTLDITASAGTTFIIDITSLTLGNIGGAAVNFDQMLSYAWLIADFASVTGFDATDFTVDASGFTNPYTGIFDVSLGGVGVVPGDASQIYVTYTAIPEPKAVLLGCLGVLLLLRRRR
ncbi:MAG: autotransporter-associated beta strand repeat-containing protein [Verrucomicrobiota bacterium]